MQWNNFIKLTMTCSLLITLNGYAQFDGKITFRKPINEVKDPTKKEYWTTGMEGMLFSTSYYSRNGVDKSLSPLRFSAFFHMGARYHYNFSDKVGFMTGFGIKNIGFIDKYNDNDSTVKRRVYSLSVPMALKFGDLAADKYFTVGAAVDLALHYKEKGYIQRSSKVKYTEWFSNRTPMIMPNVFAGFVFPSGLYMTYHYYPINFLNQTYTNADGSKPYAGYTVNLMYVSLGWTIRHFPKYDR